MAEKFEEIIEILLYEIYEYYRIMKMTDPIEEDFIADIAPEDKSPMFARKAIESLSGQGPVVQTRADPVAYEITVNGIRNIEAKLADSESFLHGNLNPHDGSVPSKNLLEEKAHKDEWEPLKIDREAPDYKNGVSAVEEVIETVVGDNGYAANEPEKESISYGR